MFRHVRRNLTLLAALIVPLALLTVVINLRFVFDRSDPDDYPYKLNKVKSLVHTYIGSKDTNKDGYDEIFTTFNRATQNNIYPNRIQQLDNDFSPYQEWGVPGIIRSPINFLDLNDDGIDEVFIWYTRLDTAYLDIRTQSDSSIFLKPIATTDDQSNKDYKEWHCAGILLDYVDTNLDGKKELIFLVATFYGASPRGICAVEYPSGKIVWDYRMGAAPTYYEAGDINGDGWNEYIIGSTTPMNLRKPINGTLDDTSYLIILDHNGNQLFSKRMGGKGSAVVPFVKDINKDGIDECIVLTYYYQQEFKNRESRFYLLDKKNFHLKPIIDPLPFTLAFHILEDLDNDGIYELFLVDKQKRAMIFSLHQNGRRLKLERKASLGTIGFKNFCLIFARDLDLDGKKEVVLPGETGIYIIDCNLDITAYYPNNINPIIISRGKEYPYILTHTQDFKNSEILVYQKNPFYIFNRIRSSMFLLATLALILGFILLYRYSLKLTSLMPLECHDRLWMEIDRKGEIYQMSHALQRFFNLRNIYFPVKLETVFSEENAKVLKQFLTKLNRGKIEDSLTMITPALEKREMNSYVFSLPALVIPARWILVLSETEISISERLKNWLIIIRAMVHNLKGPLTIAFMQINRLKKEIIEKGLANESTNKKLDGISEEIERSRNVTNKFLNFLDAWQLKPRPCDINEMIETIVVDFQEYAEALPNIKLNLSPEIPLIRTNHNLLKMALENVILNAVEATIDNHGEIYISTELEIHPSTAKREIKHWINIEILDTGVGIEADFLQNIFTSHVSTKPGGSGLGLTITKEILDWLKGFVEIKSQKDLGTTVNIFLPIESPIT